MELLIVGALAVACILTAVETFFRPLGKFRGLLALPLSVGACALLQVWVVYLPVYSLAVTFLGLTLSLLVEKIFVGGNFRTLPKRIPSRDLPGRQ